MTSIIFSLELWRKIPQPIDSIYNDDWFHQCSMYTSVWVPLFATNSAICVDIVAVSVWSDEGHAMLVHNVCSKQ